MISASTYQSSCYERGGEIHHHDMATTNCIGAIENFQRQLLSRQRQCRRRRGRDWAHIGADLLEQIQKGLPLSDILRCRAVCRSWRSVTKTYLSNSLQKSQPPLIIWNDVKKFRDRHHWCFIDLLRGGNLYQPNSKSEELLGGMDCCVGYSSPSGYFLFSEMRLEEETLCLFHPTLLSGCSIRFPLIGFPSPIDGDEAIMKAVMWGTDPVVVSTPSPSSTSSSYGGLVILHESYCSPLFAKCGATRFTQLQLQYPTQTEEGEDTYTAVEDIICVNNMIYGITRHQARYYFNAWDCSTIDEGDVPRLVLDFEAELRSSSITTLHLVESQGEILVVAVDRPARSTLNTKGGSGRNITGYNKLYPMCKVFKMDFNKKEWVHMDSLGDRVLFIMPFQSISLSTHEFPQYQSNSIYFRLRRETCDGCEVPPFVSVFNLADGSLKVIRSQSQ